MERQANPKLFELSGQFSEFCNESVQIFLEPNDPIIEIKALSGGKGIVLTINPPNQKPISLTIPIKSIGSLVAGFLGAAVASAQQTGASPTQVLESAQQSDIQYVSANGLHMCDLPGKPDAVGLVLQFGLAHLGVALTREILKPLGAALLAASAPEDRRTQH